MNRNSNTRPLLWAGGLVGALVLAGGGYWLGMRSSMSGAASATSPADEPQALYWYDPMYPDKHFAKPGKSPFMDMQLVPKYAESGAPATREPLYWYDPMQPDKHFDKPGKSPFMDMQLVAKYPEAGQANGDDAQSVRVSAAVLQNLGVRTAVVEMGALSAGAHVPGSIAWDQRATSAVSARADGVIEKLFVRAPYESVRKGQALAELVAPEWNAAAQEYLALGRAGSADARALQGAARSRLRVLGMDEGQIRSLRGSPRVVLRAPRDGIVSQLDVREGQRVQAGMPLRGRGAAAQCRCRESHADGADRARQPRPAAGAGDVCRPAIRQRRRRVASFTARRGTDCHRQRCAGDRGAWRRSLQAGAGDHRARGRRSYRDPVRPVRR